MADAYLTVDQEAYWGNSEFLADIGPIIGAVNINSDLSFVRRVVLGSDRATADVALVSYRFDVPRMRIGDESEAMRLNDEASFAVVRTDDEMAMFVGLAVTSGIPLQAASQGEITGNVPIAPAGTVFRARAVRLDGNDIDVVPNMAIYAVVTQGQGQITYGGDVTAVADPGIYFVGFSDADEVLVAASLRGWLLHSLERAAL